jgi:hypothetical protein
VGRARFFATSPEWFGPLLLYLLGAQMGWAAAFYSFAFFVFFFFLFSLLFSFFILNHFFFYFYVFLFFLLPFFVILFSYFTNHQTPPFSNRNPLCN